MGLDIFGNQKNNYKPDHTARNTFYWPDNLKQSNIVWRLPRNISWNDNLVVREDECAIFFRDGKAMHAFDRPDRYAITTMNVPVLGTLGKLVTGVEQIGEVYWVQKREFRGNFSSPDTLTYRDVDFGLVRIITSGQFAFRINEPMLFITQFIGTKGLQHSDEIINWLKDQIMMVINTTLGKLKKEKQMGVLDMPAFLPEIEQICLSQLKCETYQYGILITKFSGLAIKLPEVVQEAIDKRSAMSALGVNFMQLQTGQAIGGIGEGASKGGGDASGFAGIGAGLGAGYAMSQAMNQAMNQNMNPNAHQIGISNENANKAYVCPFCNKSISSGAKYCPECGKKLINNCPKCNANLEPGVKYCPNCGEEINYNEI